MGHLEELRGRLFKMVVAYAVASTVAWFLYEHLLRLLISPLARLSAADQILRNGQLIYTAPTEAFLVRLKVVAFAGLVMALPVVLWQLWRFVTPGLHKHEKRYALPFVLVSMVLFALGVSVAFASLPKAPEVLAPSGHLQVLEKEVPKVVVVRQQEDSCRRSCADCVRTAAPRHQPACCRLGLSYAFRASTPDGFRTHDLRLERAVS